MKALEILKTINRRYCTDSVCGKLDLAIKELEVKGNSMQLEVGEYYLSASGEIIKIVHYDKYGFRFEDENVNYYKEDGVIYGDCREFDLIAEIPTSLHQHLIQTIIDYHTDSDFKATIDSVYKTNER